MTLHCMWQVVEVSNVSWEDIGGLDDVKCELQEVNIVLVHLVFTSIFRLCLMLTLK